ncbi:ATP-binding protein [Maricurvus nonylphenolicus]|uniref:ATP-binding protein n=1 Tax=Maricurvus nonylphenolicus TaxID=1008307 RepID=UPI0036F3DCCD
MSRIYLKIFLAFWLVTITMIIGSIMALHWYDLGPDKHLPQESERSYTGPGSRLLREVVSEAINYNYHEVVYGVRRMPPWATRHMFLLNRDGEDVLGREIPPSIKQVADVLTPLSPYYQQKHHKEELPHIGRYFTLQDGHPIRLIIIPPPQGTNLRLQLFLNNLWKAILVCMLISASACFILARHITRDIRHIQDATRQIAKGNMDVSLSEHFHCRHDEMAELGRDIDHMTASLKKAMSEQKRLIKDVSHELRSPLARLQLALAIAQQRSNGDIDDELNRIKEAGEYLNDVISDILSLPMTDQGEWELNDAVELNSLLETITDNCRTEAESKRVQLNLQNCDDEALVMTHGNTLISAFENILRNAIHYTREDTQVEVILQTNKDDSYSVQICDRGPGVDEESLKDIFEPFFRTDSARARSSGGYGLGLAIAQRTVNLHGGKITAHNQPQGGLCVAIELPGAT